MKIAIANDSLMAAEALRRVLVAGGHQPAWIARDGEEALRLCAQERPDLLLMDLNMPRVDGVEATRRIMREAPCAILVVTARPDDSVGQVFRALGAGALDVAATPVLLGEGRGAAELLAKIRTIGVLVTGHAQAKSQAEAPPPREHGADGGVRHLVAIGASTGGPSALARMLGDWTPPPDVALVVVQHIDAAFAPQLARWLDEQLAMPVRVIAEGATLAGATLHVARSNDHLRLGPGPHLHYHPDPRELPYRPSIDVFFSSVARHWTGPATGVLLTGMGRDGAEGLLALRQAGHATFAQDQSSSAVYGMPRAAAEIGAAQHILSIDNILSALQGKITRSA